jgi:3-oxoacyl-[acyl-carrier protein] reductase
VDGDNGTGVKLRSRDVPLGPAPSPPLSGRVALVTGVSRRIGIGFAAAGRLLELGACVFAQSWTPHDARTPWGADPAGIDAVIDELRGRGRVEHMKADFAGPLAPGRVVEAARDRLGHLDILIANHARGGSGTLAETTAAELDAFLHENVRATVLLVQAFAAGHDGRPGGRVVMMTSGQHLGPMGGEVAYAISKGAIHQATATLADALAERGITVNTVNPGPTDTGYAPPDAHAAVTAKMPLGRWGQPRDAAHLIGWLCTDEAAWITGQVINSEGGFRRG